MSTHRSNPPFHVERARTVYQEQVGALRDRIEAKLGDLKQEGTTGVGVQCLKQLISTSGLRFPSPNVFERAFDEALALARKPIEVY